MGLDLKVWLKDEKDTLTIGKFVTKKNLHIEMLLELPTPTSTQHK
jgi:hypothetical protein